MTDTRLVVGAGLLVWLGAALVLSGWSRIARPSLTERLRPFHPARTPAPGGAGGAGYPLLVQLIRDSGDRLAYRLGVSEGAERRLRRVHSGVTAGAFRMRQFVGSATALVAGSVIALVSGPPAPAAVLLVLGSPVLVFLATEQWLASRSESWQSSTAQELPVIAEQLAMLLNAGFSVGSAVHRLAERGRGCVSRDLETVVNRVQQGLSEEAALKEWADLVRVDCVHRLVSVLTLHSQATDLGRLVSAEARAARRDLQRSLVEQIERRAEQVWVPVTVATLVPGAILLAVPFLAALHTFANA